MNIKSLTMIASLALISSVSFANDTVKKEVNPHSSYAQHDQDKWWHDRDINDDGKISKQEYVTTETKDSNKTVNEATSEFNKKDDDKDGYVSSSEFKGWFEKFGDKVQHKSHELKNDAKDNTNKMKKEYRESDINNNGK